VWWWAPFQGTMVQTKTRVMWSALGLPTQVIVRFSWEEYLCFLKGGGSCTPIFSKKCLHSFVFEFSLDNNLITTTTPFWGFELKEMSFVRKREWIFVVKILYITPITSTKGHPLGRPFIRTDLFFSNWCMLKIEMTIQRKSNQFTCIFQINSKHEYDL
jgi:hypothetical protein